MAFDIVAKYKLLFKDLASRGLIGAAVSAKNLVGQLGAATWAATKLGGAVAKLGGSVAKFGIGFAKFGGAFATVSGTLVGSKIISVQREFDVLNSSLITAMGSSEAAAKKFKELNEFAANTPYTLDQSVRGFVQLKNFGLDPTIEKMRAYGDIASAMGKDLSQMIEAVADAVTFEFERLKEFGITSSQDKKLGIVDVTFQGKTERIKRDAKSIQQYLLKVAKNFEGAMERRMATLDGAFANFGLRFNNAFLKISQSGIGQALASVINKAAGYLAEFYDYMDSDEGKKKVASIVNTIKTTWGQLKSFLGPIISYLRLKIGDAIDYITELKRAFEFGADSNMLGQFPTSMQIIVKAVDKAKWAFKTLWNWIDKVIQLGLDITAWAIEYQDALIALGVGIGAVVTAFLSVVTVMKTYTAVMAIANLLTASFGVIFGLLTAPVTLVIAAIVGVIALFTYLYRKNEKFRNIVNNSVDYLKDKFTKAFTYIGNFIETIFNNLKKAFYTIINFFIDGLNMMVRGLNSVSSYVPVVGGDLQITEFEKWGVEHMLKADKAAESRAVVAKSLINLSVAITGDVKGAENVKANVSADGYKSLGGNNSFVSKR